MRLFHAYRGKHERGSAPSQREDDRGRAAGPATVTTTEAMPSSDAKPQASAVPEAAWPSGIPVQRQAAAD